MKRAQRFLALALALTVILAFVGCGSSDSKSAAAPAAVDDSYYSYSTSAMDAGAAMEDSYYEYGDSNMKESSGLSGVTGDAGPQDMSEKIIYNATATLETVEFDQALEKITGMVRELEGYMERTSVSGSDYNSLSRGTKGARRAYYTIRVPSRSFNALVSGFSQIGNVPSCETSSQNITMRYYDTQSRLNAYRTQETRLLEMLSIAESVEDMLAIQEQLTEVQYEIDSLTGTLRYYDNQVGYSTVELTVKEVIEYTPEPEIKLTYWQRMGQGFEKSLKGTGRFFTEFFLWLVTSLPWLVPLAGAIAAVVALLRRRAKRNPEIARRRAEKKERRAARRAQRSARKAAKKGAAPPEIPAESAPAPANAETEAPEQKQDP